MFFLKKSIKPLFAILIIGCGYNRLAAQTPTSTKNYIMETAVKVSGKKDVPNLVGLPVGSANRNISYIDGIGRPLQTVQWQGSPSGKDIVQHVGYDELGREAIKYLPYAEQTGTDGSYKSGAAASQVSFYSSGSGWDANVAKTPYPYSQTVFEASPLSRVLEQGAPGAVWQPYSGSISVSGHTVKIDNVFNGTGEAALWTVGSSGASTGGSYAANVLYKTVSRDENWTSGKAGTVAEFRDKQGRVVLKRQWLQDTDSLSTYYIYDDLGNLRYVVPPAVTAPSFTEASDSNFSNFIYGYHYDGRRRVTEKKIPGRGWEHLVYNMLDQVVMAQDSLQRANNQWLFTKYDAQGRAMITGLLNSSSIRAAWQTSIDGQSSLWEVRDDSNGSGTGTGYTNSSLPTSGIGAYYTINYFDDYSFYGNSFSPGITVSTMTKGLSTGSRLNVLGSSTMLLSVSYYDEDGRMVLSKADNHLGGTDAVANDYNFAGELTTSTRTHIVGSTTTTIANSFVYDHVGRKISTKENINAQGEVVLNKMEYNEIGQLKKKNLHSTDNGSNFYQNTKFSYNERGWMRGSTSAEFGMKLGYDTLSNPQYNGNISTQLWGASFANQFDYAYDKLNRLTNGTTSSGISMGEVLTYDRMGNIATLARDGGTAGTYNYMGNQLSNISTGPLATGSYAYDGNGNATTDGRNGVTFTYNHLNLPATAGKSGLSMAYTYDGTGQKLRKVNSTSGTTTDYIDGIQYTNGAIDFIQTEEGRALSNGGTYTYQYNLSDHLGNVRYSFDIYGGAVRKLQEDDYYAFGLRHVATGGTNGYLYNGKELQDELGQYDYGARFYDPIVGRWNTVDPKAGKFPNWSPYVYVEDNPIMYIDPDGAEPIYDHKSFFLQFGVAAYLNAKSRGLSTYGAVTIVSQMALESGWASNPATRKNNNPFSLMENGKPIAFPDLNSAMGSYFKNLDKHWPKAVPLLSNETFTADQFNEAFNTGDNETSGGSYMVRDQTNNYDYGEKIINQVNKTIVGRFMKALDEGIGDNNKIIMEESSAAASNMKLLGKAFGKGDMKSVGDLADLINKSRSKINSAQEEKDKLNQIKNDLKNLQ